MYYVIYLSISTLFCEIRLETIFYKKTLSHLGPNELQKQTEKGLDWHIVVVCNNNIEEPKRLRVTTTALAYIM